MALKKEITNEYGVDFQYHKISDVRIINKDGDVQIRMIVDSYLNEEQRRSGKASIRTENIIQHADFALTPFYALLKAKFPQYENAEDVVEETTDAIPAIMTQQSMDGKLISQTKEGE